MYLTLAFKKFRRNLADYGLAIAFHKTVEALASPFYRHKVYRIYCIDPTTASAPEGDLPSGIRLSLLDASDKHAIRQITQMAEWLDGRMETMLASGDLCVVASQDSTVCGFNLIAFGCAYISHLAMTRVFRPHQAWSEHIAVAQPYRQLGLASELRHCVFRELSKRGVRKLYGGTLLHNLPSLKMAHKLGFKMLADVHFTRWFGKRSYRYKRVHHENARTDPRVDRRPLQLSR